MTAAEVIAELKVAIKRAGGRQEWIKAIFSKTGSKVSETYLCDVLAGRRAPGPSITAPLGIERVTIYRRIKP